MEYRYWSLIFDKKERTYFAHSEILLTLRKEGSIYARECQNFLGLRKQTFFYANTPSALSLLDMLVFLFSAIFLFQ